LSKGALDAPMDTTITTAVVRQFELAKLDEAREGSIIRLWILHNPKDIQ
jgi:hypothetical protein